MQRVYTKTRITFDLMSRLIAVAKSFWSAGAAWNEKDLKNRGASRNPARLLSIASHNFFTYTTNRNLEYFARFQPLKQGQLVQMPFWSHHMLDPWFNNNFLYRYVFSKGFAPGSCKYWLFCKVGRHDHHQFRQQTAMCALQTIQKCNLYT